MKKALASILPLLGLLATAVAQEGPYAPSVGKTGSTAISSSDPRFVGWATQVGSVVRGPYDISDEESPFANFGKLSAVVGPVNAFDSSTQLPDITEDSVLSLGDGGSITLLFASPITNGPGADFAVFENAFNDTFLELAFVEVSSDGSTFFRFPTSSLTQTTTQITQQSATNNGIVASYIDGFAGKYRVGWGTPFDLAGLAGTPGLDIDSIVAVRLIDVVGSINPLYGTRDSAGNLINDPWKTAFNTGGFDLDAVGVLHQIPEPQTAVLFALGLLGCGARRRR